MDVSLNQEMRENFERNKQLIDFECIPVHIKNEIEDTIRGYDIKPLDGAKVFKYMMTQKLGGFSLDLQDYIGALKKLG